MSVIRTGTAILALVMAAAIGYGFVAGDFGSEGSTILELAWGRVTLIDLYVGLGLFAAWVLLRDGPRRAIPWLVGFVVLGNLATALYAFGAARRAGSVEEFLLGKS
ncbi:MAG: hypothetical protein HKN74_03200 [Acidimicrobiia bacterium]|nr:hypothetical protein [Acidimicrobiia bacterium]NNF09271.1 hypothetical protein [Acidimicrobiia bacterium]NNL70027.1 hypothetical protein [Acidimicrobiia bacterium]